MAKVLISYFSQYGDHSYLGMQNELIKNGNDVFLVNWNNIIEPATEWSKTIIKREFYSIKDEIILFSPDLVLNFCFALPVNILKELSCPVCIIDADNPNAFWNIEDFKKFVSSPNCYFWGLESSSRKKIEDFIKINIEDNHFMYAPMASTMKKQNILYKRNILFLGSVWLRYAEIPSSEKYKFIEYCYNQYRDNFCCNKNKLIENYKKSLSNESIYSATPQEAEFLFWHFAGQQRMKFLDVLADLGLEVYGNEWKRIASCFNMEISKIANDGLISNMEEVSKLYNSSKITVNFSNPQAPTGVSWRVFDIMASNSCLLVEDKLDWKETFASYLSQETLDTIIYKDRFDMRDKAKKLLANEDLRLHCVKDLNDAVEKNGRWIHRFIKLEKFLNIKLCNLPTKNPKSIIKLVSTNTYIDKSNSQESVKQKIVNKSSKKEKSLRLSLKKRVKLFVYLLLLAIWQIPILDLGVRRNRREKILHKIHKYWR